MDRILVIDDSPLICKIIESAFVNSEIDVFTALTGEDGVNIALEKRPDLILLDIILKNTTGFEVFKILKAHELTENIPVIFITSNKDDKTVSECFSYGAVDYVSKPFNNSELKARVSMHINNRRMQLKLHKAMDELIRLANIDPLTNIYNRRCFLNKISEFTREVVNNVVVVICDIDNFKSVNDTYGHDVGDDVLKQASKIFKKGVGANGIVARWGGEEFIFAIPNIDIEKACKLCNEIREELGKFVFHTENYRFSCSVTMGLCERAWESSIEGDVARADAALYLGKNTGKDKCVIAD